MMGKNWYGLGLVLLLLSLLNVVLLDYRDHAAVGILFGIWALACLVMGLRSELKK